MRRANVPEYVASVLVSHADEDKPFVRAVCALLEARGCRMWIDEDDLRVGDNLPEGVFTAIDRVDFVLSMISANSVESGWCRKEWWFAISVEIRRRVVVVLPVRMDDTPMPLLFEDKVHLDVRSMSPRQAADKIMAAIREHVAPTRELPARRVRQTHVSPPTPSRAARPPRRRRLRQSALLGAVLVALSVGPASPAASYTEGRHWGHLPYA
jgi:hypothetical protein